MTTIITRSGKGSPLTIAELDSNLTNLNNGKFDDSDARSNTRPSLLLAFDKTKVLDPRITYSRSSGATYYDNDSVALAEQNLLTYSQNISNTTWWINQNIVVSSIANTAPDGTTTANLITAIAGTVYPQTYQTITVSNVPYTYSVYLKYVTNQFAFLAYETNNSFWSSVTVDLINGVITQNLSGSSGSPISSSITSVGSGWYRVTLTASSSGYSLGLFKVALCNTGTPAIGLYAGYTYTTTGTESILVWGQQVEQRSQVTVYTPTTTTSNTNYIPQLLTANNNVARFDHNPTTRESLGLLIEEQRTNQLYASSNFDSYYWSKVYNTNLTISSNAIIAPDGTQTATIIKFQSGNTYNIYQAISGGSALRTFSVWLKAPVATNIDFGFYDNGTYSTNTINITTDWQRFTYSNTVSGAADCRAWLISKSAGETIYAWGAQLELGAFATSYIPTPLVYSGRASTATYLGANGYIQTANTNIQRFQLNTIGTPQTLLENGATNLLNWTEKTTWWPGNNGASEVPSVTIAPDGNQTAGFSFTNGFFNAGDWLETTTITSTASSYVFSVYAKQSSTSLGFNIFYYSDSIPTTVVNAGFSFSSMNTTPNYSGTGTNGGYGWNYVSNGWYRVYLYVNAGYTVGQLLRVYMDVDGSGSRVGKGNYYWGGQLETGISPTSYIPSIQTFTSRSANAYYYDTSTTALAEQNLVVYSENYSNTSIWNQSGATIYSNTMVSPANTSTNTASSLVDNVGLGWHYVTQYLQASANYNMLPNTVYTASIYAKAIPGNSRWLRWYVYDGYTQFYQLFDVANGAIGTTSTGNIASKSITPSSNGWYRCVITFTSSVNPNTLSAQFSPTLANTDNAIQYTGDGVSGLYIWGAQLEQRANVTAYTPTTTTSITNYIPVMQKANTNIARFDYDPVTRAYKGLMVEPQSINLTYNSSAFNSWSVPAYNTIIDQTSTIAPDGTLTANKFTCSNTWTEVGVRTSTTGMVGGNNTYVVSCYAKAGTANTFLIRNISAGNGSLASDAAFFNIQNGTVGTRGANVTSSFISSVGNGWYRCSMVGNTPTTITNNYVDLRICQTDNYNGATTGQYAFVWGAQIESGAVATSYIPTTSTTVTRAADIATSTAQTRATDVYSSSTATRVQDNVTMTGTNLKSWWNSNLGTFTWTGKSQCTAAQSNSSRLFISGDASAGSILYFNANSNYVNSYDYNAVGTPIADLTLPHQLAVVYSTQNNSKSVYVDGFSAGTGNHGVAWNATSTLSFSLYPAFWAKRIAYYPRVLSNTEIVSLTT